MDEPTSAITEHEIEVLFGIVENLKQRGVAIAYITHKLEELGRIGDDAVVMRDGKVIGAAPLKDLRHDEIIRMMVGRAVVRSSSHSQRRPSQEVLRVESLSLGHPGRPGDFLFKDVSFHVGRGEVLGIFGLMGAGRTELLETIFGLHPSSATGTTFINGQPVKLNSPVEAIRDGIALAPEDRKREGVVADLSVAGNTSLACLPGLERFGLIDESAERELVGTSIARFRIKTPSQEQAIRNLSGGNQQKVILAKWLATKPRVLLLDEPTRGIDVNAKAEIYALIDELVADGLAVIVVSSELPEILAISDRLIVLCEGELTAEFNRAEAGEEAVMNAALPK
jgi:ribose transport system ATP-binding protein